MMRRTLCVFVAMSMTSCVLGPEFLRPDAKAPQTWREQRGDTQASTPVAAAIGEKWWERFNDPVLSSLENRVLQANFDIQVATLHLVQSRAQRAAVLGGRLQIGRAHV